MAVVVIRTVTQPRSCTRLPLLLDLQLIPQATGTGKGRSPVSVDPRTESLNRGLHLLVDGTPLSTRTQRRVELRLLDRQRSRHFVRHQRQNTNLPVVLQCKLQRRVQRQLQRTTGNRRLVWSRRCGTPHSNAPLNICSRVVGTCIGFIRDVSSGNRLY